MGIWDDTDKHREVYIKTVNKLEEILSKSPEQFKWIDRTENDDLRALIGRGFVYQLNDKGFDYYISHSKFTGSFDSGGGTDYYWNIDVFQGREQLFHFDDYSNKMFNRIDHYFSEKSAEKRKQEEINKEKNLERKRGEFNDYLNTER